MTMTTSSQSALTWQDGAIPVSTRFDDPYFSLNDGLSETRHVFLAGNDLPARLTPDFHVAELGFGTGLNLLALSLITKTPIRFTSFEAFPLPAADIARALDHFPEARAVADPFLAAWAAGETRFQLGPISVEIILGDARETLAQWPHKANAWFLDGFSPAKNPELWSPEILTQVARHTATGGTFATYTAAGHVRRALQDAGFAVERRPGHGRKRHMSAGILR
ncbi:tRNA (5-methylaminomethyl-2-thiouridine)(34)-methyltransferase MnmD [Cypionkella sinensis]|uniref:tRNA (5-methylaminomethyl-2-thiouridine)(34)-methyltransferase MnmD n=1 Tax=Cypionkella sinensis TaxID=1756043 RepID=A0ABV7J588_9RHOB